MSTRYQLQSRYAIAVNKRHREGLASKPQGSLQLRAAAGEEAWRTLATRKELPTCAGFCAFAHRAQALNHECSVAMAMLFSMIQHTVQSLRSGVSG